MIQNLSIQIVPLNTLDAYSQIDLAIEIIKNSGLHYTVTAFNTQVEGQLEELQNLVREIQTELFKNGTEEVLMNLQYHAKKDKSVFLVEKTDSAQK